MYESTVPGLEPYSRWFDSVILKPDGKPYSERQKRAFAKRYQLPVIIAGWCRLIDPAAGARRLAELPEQQKRRGRGRPRAGTGSAK